MEQFEVSPSNNSDSSEQNNILQANNINVPVQRNPNNQRRIPLLRYIFLLKTWRKSCLFFMLYFPPIIIISFIVAIVYWKSSCKQPLQVWFLVLGLLHICQFALTLRVYLGLPAVDESLQEQENKVRSVFLYYTISRILDFVWFIWFAQGTTWIFTSECNQNSQSIYKAAFGFFLLHCIIILFIISSCCNVCCGLLLHIVMQHGDIQTGASKSIINKLKLTKYNETTISKEDSICAVCLGEYEQDEELRHLPCNHHFHSLCIDQWLSINKVCPLCKKDIQNETEV